MESQGQQKQNVFGRAMLAISHLRDTPHQIALGAAIGVFVAWSPTWGFHMLIALAMSTLLRANKFVAVACVWVHNPLTMVPMLYASYVAGRAVLSPWVGTSTGMSDIKSLLSNFAGLHIFSSFHQPSFWPRLFRDILGLGIDVWIGTIVLGLISAAAAYVLVYTIVKWHRRGGASGF